MAQMIKNPPAMQETQVQSLDQEDPWRREWLTIPVFLPKEFHGQKSFADLETFFLPLFLLLACFILLFPKSFEQYPMSLSQHWWPKGLMRNTAAYG